MYFEDQKKKAKSFLEINGISKLLINAYLEIQHYGSWVINQKNKDWNIGLTKIKNEKLNSIKIKQRDPYSIDLVSAQLLDIDFKIGGYRYSISAPFGDDYWIYQVVLFYIGDKLVIEAEYEDTGRDYSLPSDYKLVSVEEFHNQPEIMILLSEIDRLIVYKEKAEEQKEIDKLEEKYKDKFTF